jgi:phosphopantetheinyl transferase (holo-ACP synthase)
MGNAARVGNDVVDLDEPAIATTHLRERFVARVCDASERDALARAPHPKVLLWSFFAAKEAAYKVVAKLGPPPPFAHRRFVVALDLRSVSFGSFSFRLKIEVEATYVHAVATTDVEFPLHAVANVPEGADLGVEARGLLRTSIARRLGWRESDLAVVRPPRAESFDGLAPPALLREGRPTGIDVSLSHDGRYVAFAADVRRD